MSDENGDEVIDFGEMLDEEAEKMIFDKNHARTVALSELWLSEMEQKIQESDIPPERRYEMMFYLLTNSLFDLVMGVIPEEVSLMVARNLDEYLKVTLVNAKYGTDLMQDFQKEFMEEHGSQFETEEELDQKLETFEANWWHTKREDLGGKTPSKAAKEMAEEYGL
ncbi:MAG: hypothetical protein ACLFPN_05735 [Methanomassiliicoccales archaeon]